MLDQSNTTLPRKEMYSAFSVWTKDSVDFGGVAPADGPNWSYFSDIRRLICDDVRIDPAFSAPVASVTPLAQAKVQVEQNNANSSTASVTSSTSATSSTAPAVAKMNVTTSVSGAATAGASAGAALLSAAVAAAVLLL
jgi:hypothetical protein